MANAIIKLSACCTIANARPYCTIPDRGTLFLGVNNLGYLYRTLIYFDLNILERDININEAILKLFIDYIDGENESIFIQPFLILSDWKENETCWLNQPDFLTCEYIDPVSINKSGWYSINITEFVNKWQSEGYTNYGIILLSNESQVNTLIKLYSPNSYYHILQCPQLELSYSYKNQVGLASRYSESLSEQHTSLDIIQYSSWFDCLEFSKYTFFIQNIGLEPVDLSVQISPDKIMIIDEPPTYKLNPKSSKAVTPMNYSYYARIAYKASCFNRKSNIKIFFQAQV